MKYGSLFSGFGGIDLGLDRAGMECAFQVENDPYALKVLEKHWPRVERFTDVRKFEPERGSVELIAGGFPCQDLSNAANNRQGLDGERSGLWWEMLRIVERAKPSFVLIENVSALRRMGLGVVLRELSALGYDAEWATLRAAQFGFPHNRPRLFVVAYPNGIQWGPGSGDQRSNALDPRPKFNAEAMECKSGWEFQRWIVETYAALGFSSIDPATRGTINGIPNRVERLKGCGNAVVPHIAQWIGLRIIEMHRQMSAR